MLLNANETLVIINNIILTACTRLIFLSDFIALCSPGEAAGGKFTTGK
jgi:hypothetical protein